MNPVESLSRYPLFALLGRRRLEAWIAAGQTLTVGIGETLLQAGTAGAWAYLVLQGRVRVLRSPAVGREVCLGVYRPGQLFGDYALLPPHTNTATCRACDPGRVLRLPLLPLRQAFDRLAEVRDNLKNWLRLHALVCHLRQEPFLGFLSGPSALRLLDHCRPTIFAPGRTIQVDGLGADRWFFLEAGRVRLCPNGEEADPSGQELGPGECFGERTLAAWSGLPRAVAVDEVRCLSLRRADFWPSGPASLQTLAAVRASFPWVGQQEAADCGVAALAMVARCHGLDVTPQRLCSLVRTGPTGATLFDLQRGAEALGLRCRAVRIGAEQLAEAALPAVAHMIDGHYVVLYAVRREGVVLGDPASGIVTVSQTLFCRACSGRLLLLSPGPPAL